VGVASETGASMPSWRAPHRSAAFLRSYAALPHRALNRGLARLTRARRPRAAIDAAIRIWTRLERIELEDFEPRRFESLDDFFLRRLRAGRRPLGSGFVSPADGRLLALGELSLTRPLCIKGQRLSAHRIVNGRREDAGDALDLAAYEGGRYAVVFLTPRGYHRVHAPCDAVLEDVRFIPGRFFPQNEDALAHIERIYERNERAVLRFSAGAAREFLLVLVGASLIGGIHLEALGRADWVRAAPTAVQRAVSKGQEIGHFAFGSTVLVLLPGGLARPARQSPADVRMGETLFLT
jgi:phosphatidylserine decarboxylase